MAEDQSGMPAPEGSEAKKPTPKRRGWWWKIPLALLVLLILLVLLLPTIASTLPVRSFVLGKVNANLPGRLDVDDWSLGWFSGTRASGVAWTDAEGRRVATVAEVSTPITLSQLVRGNLHLGEVHVRGVQADVVVPVAAEKEEARLPRREEPRTPEPARAPAEPIEIPDASVNLVVEDVSGQVTFLGEDGRKAVVKLDKGTRLLANLPGGGAPATVDALVALAQPTGVSNTTLKMTVNGIRPGPLDLKAVSADGELALGGLDLQQVAEIVRAMGTELALEGQLGGQVAIRSAGPGQVSAKGEFSARDVVAKLSAEQFQTSALLIPVDVEVTGGETSAAIIRQLGVIIDQGQVNVTGEVPISAIEQLQAGGPISERGTVKVAAQAPNLPELLNALRESVKLQEGVTVTQGSFTGEVNIGIGADGITVRAPLALRDLAATREGKQVGPMAPVTLDASARIPSLGAALTEISDIAISVNSSFMTLEASGKTLASTNAEGQVDLAKLRDDFGAIVDLSAIRGGKATLKVANSITGDDAMDSDIRLQVSGVGYDLAATQTSPARRIENGSMLVAGKSHYEAGKLSSSEPLRVQAGARVLQLGTDGTWQQLLDETVGVVANLSADLGGDVTRIELTQLSMSAGKDRPMMRIGKAPGAIGVVLAGKRGITTQGTLRLWADLTRLGSLANAFSGAEPGATVQSGEFNGELAFAVSESGDVRVALENGRSQFTYVPSADAQPYSDNLQAAFEATLAGDDSAAKVSADVKSKLATLVLNADAGLNLAAEGAAKLRHVNISKLDAQTAFASVSLSKPLVISDVPALLDAIGGGSLPEGSQVGGELIVRADLAKAASFATTQPAGAQVSGQLISRDTISLTGNQIVADTQTEIADLQVIQDGKATVEEPRLTLSGSVRVEPGAKVLQLTDFAISSASRMLDVKAALRVDDLGATNQLRNSRITITPDWSKLWPAIYAMLPAEKQQKMGELVVEGKRPITISLDGRFPTNQPYEQAIRQLVASGAIPIELADWKTYGLVAAGEVPFRLEDGSIHFIEGTLQEPKPAEPLVVNDGTVDLSAARIDITTDIPRANIPDNTPLVRGVRLNRVLLASMGKLANPLFADPQNASGSVDVTVAYCRGLPLTTAIYDPAAGGEAQLLIDMQQLDLTGKGINMFLGVLRVAPGEGQDHIVGEIRKGVVTIAKGQVDHKMDLQLGDQTFSFDGTMPLEDMSYTVLNAGVPRSMVVNLLDDWIGIEGAEQYLPEKVTLQFSGPASALRLNRSALGELAGDIARQRGATAVRGLLGGGQSGDGATTRPQEGVGGLIDALGGGKRESATQPAQETPRQDPLGGLLDRLLDRRDERK